MSGGYQESIEALSPQARDVNRALDSLVEELEAVNYYHQRADTTPDASLKAVLIHHRDEEIEHAAMLLEWLRRMIPKFDEELRTYLFTSGDLTALEEGDAGDEAGESPAGDLGIGRLEKGA